MFLRKISNTRYFIPYAIVIITTFFGCDQYFQSVDNDLYSSAYNSFTQGQYEEAISLTNQFIQLADEGTDSRAKAKGLYLRGYIHYKIDSAGQALQDYYDSKLIYEKLDEKKMVGQLQSEIGAIFFRFDSYDLALQYFKSALKVAEEVGNKKELANSYNNIGKSLIRKAEYELALEHMFLALEMENELERLSNVIDITMDIGNIHFLNGNYSLASEYYWRSINISIGTELEDYTRSRGYNNIGNNFLAQGILHDAKKYLFQSLDVPGRSEIERAATFNNIGRMFHIQDNPQLAIHYFDKSIANHGAFVDVEELKTSLEEIKLIYPLAEHPDSLAHYSLKVNYILLPQLEKNRRLQDMEIKLRLEYIHARIIAQNSKNKNQSYEIIMYMTYFILVTALILFTVELTKIYRTRLNPESIASIKNESVRQHTLNWLIYAKNMQNELVRKNKKQSQ